MKLFLITALLLAISVNFGKSDESLQSSAENPKFSRIKSIAYKPDNDTELEIDDVNAVAPKFEHFSAIDSLLEAESVSSRKKIVSFAETPTVQIIPSEPTDIFWLREKDFNRIFEKKSKLYEQSSTEFKVLDILGGVIEKSHIVYDRIYRFLVKMDGYDLYLSQAKVRVSKETTVNFPDSEVFAKLEDDKRYFKSKLRDVLILLQPSYKMNEHLFKLLKSMNKKTKIDPNLVERITAEAIIINDLVKKLTQLIIKCSLNEYKKQLSDIRKRINRLEFRKITLDTAKNCLNENMNVLTLLSPKIKKYLYLAKRVDFPELNETTDNFYDLVKNALNVW